MSCPGCGATVSEGAAACSDCGAALLTCLACGAFIPPGAKFCANCGTAVSTASAAVAARKQLTVLFTDLAGFTAMSERVDPEEMQAITGDIFVAISEAVERYEGSVERFEGDGALVLFGVPQAHEDDPIRAVRAAMEIHQRVEAISPRHEARAGCPLTMHSGINSGLAVIGNQDREAGTHGVLGDVVNTASRISGQAAAGEILVGVETWRQSAGHFDFEALAPVSVKGKTEPVGVYKVLAVRSTPSKTHGLSGIGADLIGRDRELEQLLGAIEELRAGRGSIVSICGEAGTGKSRLVAEFKKRLDRGEIQWREGHAHAYSQNTSFAPVTDLLNRAFRIEDRDSAAVIREKVESGLTQLLGGDRSAIPYIGNLHTLSYPETEDLTPEVWKPRLFEAMTRVLEALCRRGPTVICIEDLHWADPSSHELLRHAIEHVEAPCLFLFIYRPFEFDLPRQLEIRLEQLSTPDTQRMIASLLKTEKVPSELRSFVERKADGNPFYLEEVVNSLIQSGALEGRDGNWRLTRPLTESDTPPTVQGVITARLDRLDAEMRRVLQEASVIGRVFLRQILRKITQLESSIDDPLVGLETLDMIRRHVLEPDLEYIFKHALTQEVVYEGLLRKERREIHERIAVVMERLLGDRLPEFYETLAFHYSRGHSWLKAVDYLMKSGWKSLRRFALAESNRYYAEAYEILNGLPERDKVGDALLMDLFWQWTRVHYYEGEFKRLHDLLVPHRETAVALNDSVRLALYYLCLSVCTGWLGEWREAYDTSLEALRLAEQVGHKQIIAAASMWLTWMCADRGTFDEALRYGERALKLCRTEVEDHWVEAKSLDGLACVYLYMGDLRKAGEYLTATGTFGEEHGETRAVVLAHLGYAHLHLMAGEFESAAESAREGLRRAEDPLYTLFALSFLGKCEAAVGNLTEARELCERVIKESTQQGAQVFLETSSTTLGAIQIAQGEFSEGFANMEHAVRACRERGRRYYECVFEVRLGSVYVEISKRRGGSLLAALKNLGAVIKHVIPAAKKAELHLRRGLLVAEEIGAKQVLGLASLELGRLYGATRRPGPAREHLSRAVDWFELCGATTLLEQARGELASLDSAAGHSPAGEVAQRG